MHRVYPPNPPPPSHPVYSLYLPLEHRRHYAGIPSPDLGRQATACLLFLLRASWVHAWGSGRVSGWRGSSSQASIAHIAAFRSCVWLMSNRSQRTFPHAQCPTLCVCVAGLSRGCGHVQEKRTGRLVGQPAGWSKVHERLLAPASFTFWAGSVVSSKMCAPKTHQHTPTPLHMDRDALHGASNAECRPPQGRTEVKEAARKNRHSSLQSDARPSPRPSLRTQC